jgi:hypothetical protein
MPAKTAKCSRGNILSSQLRMYKDVTTAKPKKAKPQKQAADAVPKKARDPSTPQIAAFETIVPVGKTGLRDSPADSSQNEA